MAHGRAKEQGRDGSVCPCWFASRPPCAAPVVALPNLCRRKRPTQAPRFFNLGLYISCFPLLIYKQIFSHLAAPSAGQQSKLFGSATRRARTTLNFPPRAPGTPFHRLARCSSSCLENSPKGTEAAKYSRGAQQTLLSSLPSKVHLCWTLSLTRDISNSLKLLCIFQSHFLSGVLPFLSLPSSILTVTLPLSFYT